MNLVLVDVQQDALDAAAAEMQAAGSQVLARKVDVSNAAQMGSNWPLMCSSALAPPIWCSTTPVWALVAWCGRTPSRLGNGCWV